MAQGPFNKVRKEHRWALNSKDLIEVSRDAVFKSVI